MCVRGRAIGIGGGAVSLVVAKVGGSLFDLPDLRERLRGWIDSVGSSVLLVPGGGEGADVIRRLDQTHRLGDDAAHWLALGVLAVNARLLGCLLDLPIVDNLNAPFQSRAVADVHAFCRSDEGRPDRLPHAWNVTSDSIAARVAEIVGGRLVLLKSTDLPCAITWTMAGECGVVDPTFGAIVKRAGLEVAWINLRHPLQPPK
jgi:5-(aminomethyl)-3-furanmethanol phosphate kinase